MITEMPGWAPRLLRALENVAIPSNGYSLLPFRLLVTASRSWTRFTAIKQAMSFVGAHVDPCWGTMASRRHCGHVIVVHGDCPEGGDRKADQVAREFGWVPEPHPADWNTYGRKAGPVRDLQMVKLGAHLCLAFLKRSRGASLTAGMALAHHIETVRISEEDYA